jgi:plasmid stabilization system protein ParE
MTYEIRWTLEAEESFDQIVSYLKAEWTEREVRKFVRRAQMLLNQIIEFPFMFEASTSNVNVRRAFVAKQCSLFYEVHEDTVVLLYFWDNRMDPEKRIY